jgi:hypothetical protein
MSAEDAKRVRQELDRENRALSGKEIYPHEVKLKPAARAFVAEDPVNGFVVHTPREVLEFPSSLVEADQWLLGDHFGDHSSKRT